MQTLVIIPTYNEKATISTLIAEIFSLRVPGLEILVVDDNSPDGTGDLVELLRSNEPSLHILKRPRKEGLGKAYTDGFREALSMGAQNIITMDADFSHDPKSIPHFLREITTCDLVLGSRYTEGGRIENWNIPRRLTSSLGNMYARLILNLPFTDVTTGYKCYRRKTIERIDLERIDSIGYVFQVEMVYKIVKRGFSVREVPIVFTERIIGRSKFQLRMIWESFWLLLKLRLRH